MKKLLLTLFLLLGITIGSYSQSGWTSGNYYAYKGQNVTESSWATEYSIFCNCYVNVRYCRQSYWYQEYYSGYIYLWGPNGWYTEWKEGTYWYYSFGNWYLC